MRVNYLHRECAHCREPFSTLDCRTRYCGVFCAAQARAARRRAEAVAR